MRLALHCHPASACTAVTALQVDATRLADGTLALRFQLLGELTALRIPLPVSDAGPAEGLWQHTCFEAFIAADGAAYREFNFAPSGQWAAYAFTNYRERDAAWQPAAAPNITAQLTADSFVLEARLPAALLPVVRPLQIGLTTVIESADGGLSYWALAHPGARPDFHRHEAFILCIDPTTDQP